MTGEVVELASRRHDPHMQGRARCLACKAEWQCVAPVGTRDLECPQCGLQRGAWAVPLDPCYGSKVWRCNKCDGVYFWYVIAPKGFVHLTCVGCGQDHRPWDTGRGAA